MALSTLRIGRIEAADLARDPRNGHDEHFHVMAANYDSNGEAGEWDGITADDIVTVTRDDGTLDLDLLGEWGPFEVWYTGAYAPIAANVPTTARWAEHVKAARDEDGAPVLRRDPETIIADAITHWPSSDEWRAEQATNILAALAAGGYVILPGDPEGYIPGSIASFEVDTDPEQAGPVG